MTKKILSILTAVAMTIGMAATSFAATDNDVDVLPQGTDSSSEEATIDFSAYEAAVAAVNEKYGTSGEFITDTFINDPELAATLPSVEEFTKSITELAEYNAAAKEQYANEDFSNDKAPAISTRAIKSGSQNKTVNLSAGGYTAKLKVTVKYTYDNSSWVFKSCTSIKTTSPMLSDASFSSDSTSYSISGSTLTAYDTGTVYLLTDAGTGKEYYRERNFVVTASFNL